MRIVDKVQERPYHVTIAGQGPFLFTAREVERLAAAYPVLDESGMSCLVLSNDQPRPEDRFTVVTPATAGAGPAFTYLYR